MGPVSMNAAGPAVGPRISFSYGFADTTTHHQIRHAADSRRRGPHREADVAAATAVDGGFEFSVRNDSHAMRPADEIFCKGMMLAPTKNVTTLRDELLTEDEEQQSEDVLSGFKSVSCRWIERWGSSSTRKINHKSGRKN